MNRIIIYLLTAVLMLSACSMTRQYPLETEYNDQWKGRSHAEIVTEFGAPDRVESDGNGGKILVYETFSTTTTTDVDTHFGYFDPDYTTKVQTNKSYTHFFIGPDNTCYHIKSNRMELDPQSRRNAAIALKIYGGVIGLSALIVPMLLIL